MRLVLANINPIVGDIAGNAGLVRDGIHSARRAGADLVLFPELALSGYPPRDLLLREGFVHSCMSAAAQLGEHETRGLTAVFGLPVPADAAASDGIAGAASAGSFANALAAYRNGSRLALYHKRLLPTYDVFDEDRYFEPGNRPAVIDVPVGAVGGSVARVVRVGLTICEDLWKGEDAGFASRYRDSPDPVPELLALGAELIVSASASPFALGKGQKHRAILASHARRHGVYVASVNQLGGNDDLIFDGHRYLFAPGGGLVTSGKLFEEGQLVHDIPEGGAKKIAVPFPSAVSPEPPDAHGSEPSILFSALVLGVRDYARKTGFSKALIGLSGGVDSALTAVIAAAALGKDSVTGVAMPGPYSSDHALFDARDLAGRLGIPCIIVPIADAFEGLTRVSNGAFDALSERRLGAALPDLTEENLQSRIRGTLLMTLSNRTGAIVLTTGNKSETAVGYSTLYGDMNGGLAVLNDVSKHWVYRLCGHINGHSRGIPGLTHCTKPPIPQRTLDKPPSAELRPHQTDQDTLPPYDVLDAIIDRAVQGRQSSATIAHETGFDPALVRKVVGMIDRAEYKRRQAAVGLKVTSVAFGPGRRFPIAQGWKDA